MKLFVQFCFLFLIIYHTTSVLAVIEVINNKCIEDGNPSSLSCHGIESQFELLNYLKPNLEILIIENSNLTGTNDSLLELKFLHKITLLNSFIGNSSLYWIYSLENLKHLEINECFTNKTINYVNKWISSFDINISHLKTVEFLSISNCNITRLSKNNPPTFNNLKQFILEGNRFECGDEYFIWLSKLNKKEISHPVTTLKNSKCFLKKIVGADTFPAIYTLQDKDLLDVLEVRGETIYNCPPKCECKLIGLRNLKNITRPTISLYCMQVNMTELPKVIPKGTTGCNFSHNRIEDFTPFFTNNLYRTVHYMTVSHNNISYIDSSLLEDFIREKGNSVFLDFSYNNLKKFPGEEIRSIKDLEHISIQLDHNPFICSCDYISGFRKLLYRYINDMENVTEIRCSPKDPYNPGAVILFLNDKDLCSSEPVINLYDILNIVLGLVLILLVADFFYNYQQYRKHRKLPWIIKTFHC